MKRLSALPILAFVAMMGFSSCSTDNSLEETIAAKDLNNPPNVKVIEIEVLELINQHRISIGLNPLLDHSVVKAVAFTHTDYMIEADDISHDNFYQRKESLEVNAEAVSVSENVAYGFSSPQSLVNAWLNSPSHRATIEGNFTDFDISAEQNENGKWYYTNIFIKR
ncbi:CAP domain-containing protein [Winogradskyella aurantiaca]|uniref:CAP domain-containing protein n=1 Tax=Winogradskyella aurantiaca TaxID=2219558 RepID=UPI000E1DADF7|nr:CAP domain-containing protein [Winogradskyella aurantiaca]